jgi:hypothetical protein
VFQLELRGYDDDDDNNINDNHYNDAKAHLSPIFKPTAIYDKVKLCLGEE